MKRKATASTGVFLLAGMAQNYGDGLTVSAVLGTAESVKVR
jgi:hypothetical protein